MISPMATTKVEEGDLQEVKAKEMGETVVRSSLHESEVKKAGRRLPVTSIAIVLAILIWLIRILYHK